MFSRGSCFQISKKYDDFVKFWKRTGEYSSVNLRAQLDQEGLRIQQRAQLKKEEATKKQAEKGAGWTPLKEGNIGRGKGQQAAIARGGARGPGHGHGIANGHTKTKDDADVMMQPTEEKTTVRGRGTAGRAGTRARGRHWWLQHYC